jgi:6-pyruvoyltetrahydropterin/6-carboxytetrahydropterin synthase
MTYTICKRFDFSASHRLDTLPEEHPCYRLHGHNYAVELELQALKLDEHGFVHDYRALDAFKRWLDTEVDHRHLNDLFPCTSAEYLAQTFFEKWVKLIPYLHAVRVSETPKTWATYQPA